MPGKLGVAATMTCFDFRGECSGRSGFDAGLGFVAQAKRLDFVDRDSLEARQFIPARWLHIAILQDRCCRRKAESGFDEKMANIENFPRVFHRPGEGRG